MDISHEKEYKNKKKLYIQYTHFLAGTVFCKFHNFSVWSSDAVMRTGSTGWKAKARTPSKWLKKKNIENIEK